VDGLLSLVLVSSPGRSRTRSQGKSSSVMKKAAISFLPFIALGLSMAAFFVPVSAMAQSAILPFSQGDLREATTTCTGAGDCYFIYLGTSFSGTITTGFTTMDYPGNSHLPAVMTLFQFPSASYTGVESTCNLSLSATASASTSAGKLQYTGSCPMLANKYYMLDLLGGSGSVDARYRGATIVDMRYPVSYYVYPGNGGSIQTTGFEPQFGLAVNGFQITATTTDSGTSLSGAKAFCDSYFTGGSLTSDTANAMCLVGSFLFVPSQSSLQQFGDLSGVFPTKIPFSYFYQTAAILNGTSTTGNMVALSLNLNSFDAASTTGLGPILPQTTFSVFSTSTINAYLSPTMHDLLYNLAIAAIWVEVGFLLYRRIVPHQAKI